MSWIHSDGSDRSTDYGDSRCQQLQNCHSTVRDESGSGVNQETVITPIRPKARFLNQDNQYDGQSVNQLAHMAQLGYWPACPRPRQRGNRTSLAGYGGGPAESRQGLPGHQLRPLPQPRRLCQQLRPVHRNTGVRWAPPTACARHRSRRVRVPAASASTWCQATPPSRSLLSHGFQRGRCAHARNRSQRNP